MTDVRTSVHRGNTWASKSRPLTKFVHGPKAVGSFVPKLAQKSFEKFGFAAAAVLTDWQSIVGPELAAWTAPERLRWPRPADGQESANGPRAGATLFLRVAPARALDIQYKTHQIVERINAYFGYRAITDLRLVQAPLASPEPRRSAAPVPPAGARAVLRKIIDSSATGNIADQDLRQALERLGSSVALAQDRRA